MKFIFQLNPPPLKLASAALVVLATLLAPARAHAACPNAATTCNSVCTVSNNDVTCYLDDGTPTQGGVLNAYSVSSTSIKIWGTDGDGVDFCCEGGAFDDVGESGDTCSNFIEVHGVDHADYADSLSLNTASLSNTVIKMQHRVWGYAGADEIYGSADTTCGDQLYGGTEGDTIFALAGADYVEGNDGNDVCYGGDGADTIYGGADNDDLWGNAGADTLDGGTGDDRFKGGSENDTIYGQGGDDEICGEGGSDLLSGGTGNDIVLQQLGADPGSTCGADTDDSDFTEVSCEDDTWSSGCPW